MRKTSTNNRHANSPQKQQEAHLSRFATLFSFITIFFLIGTDTFAQTFPPASSCTSKDLELISATLPAPDSDPCQCSGTRTLILGIRNKTGSFRTAFALWGTLIRKDASGNQIGSEPIFACAPNVKANQDNFLPATASTPNGKITVSCGESLEIVNLYLAWTSANNNEDCNYLKNNSSKINPKCGTLPGISIGIGVTADFVVTNATCQSNGTTTGTIKVSPSGGVGPYKVKIGNDERTGIIAGGSTTFTLAPNTYNILITDSRGCNITLSRTIGSPGIVSVNAGAGFTKTCTQNTSGGTIGESAQTGFTYSWSPSTGLSDAAAANPTANPSVTTTYTLTKTSTATGCSNTASVTVTVNNTPPGVSAGSAFTKTCTQNASGSTIGETPVNGFTYSWSPATGLSNAAIGNPTANPSETTTYTLTKTNSTNGCSNTATVTVTVNNAPVTVSAGSAFTKSCTQNTSGAGIGESAQAGYTYSWSPATGLSDASAANPTANPNVTTTYTVTKTHNTSGCFKTATVTVTVDNTPPGVSAGSAFTKTCTANVNGAAIGESAEAGYTYSWSPATGLSDASIANPIANPSVTTTYTVTKTHSTSGCSNTATVTVTVNNTAVTVSAGSPFTKTCTQNTSGGTIGETPVDGFTYSWSPSTGLSNAAVGNPTANPSVTTTYTVTKTNASSGCSKTATVTVTVNNTLPTFTVCIQQPTLCANSGSVTFTASGGSGFEYSIDNGANYQSGNSFTGLSSGSVSGLLVKNSFGCVSEKADCNTTSQCPQALLAKTETAAKESSALVAEQGLRVKAFPNPFNSRVRFEVNATQAGPGSLEVYNTLGQKVKTIYQGFMNAGKQTFELNIPANQRATLIYILKMGDQQVTGKLFQSGN